MPLDADFHNNLGLLHVVLQAKLQYILPGNLVFHHTEATVHHTVLPGSTQPPLHILGVHLLEVLCFYYQLMATGHNFALLHNIQSLGHNWGHVQVLLFFPLQKVGVCGGHWQLLRLKSIKYCQSVDLIKVTNVYQINTVESSTSCLILLAKGRS